MGLRKGQTNGVKFSANRQPSAESMKKRAETQRKKGAIRRELRALLSIRLAGQTGKEINESLKELGIKANTLEEAMHFAQISKAITSSDTSAYNAIINAVNENKHTEIIIPAEIVIDFRKAQ